MLEQFRPAFVSFATLTFITGLIYPAIVTGVASVAFPYQAAGSVMIRDGRAVGSELIAQPFTDAKYFWPRPSAANYDAAAGSGSNLAPSNPALAEAVKARIDALRSSGTDPAALVPVDLVTASGSGLDPHLSLAATRYQAARVAAARHMAPEAVDRLIEQCTEGATFGVLGEPRVNVLRLNDILDHGVAVAHADLMTRAHGFWPASH